MENEMSAMVVHPPPLPVDLGRRSRKKGSKVQPINDLPFKVSLSEERTERNFRNGTLVVKFTAKIIVSGQVILEVPDLALIDGRIQIPAIRRRISGGEIHTKVVKPVYAFLKAVHEAIERSDWYERYPDLPPLIPVVPKGSLPRTEEEEALAYGEEDDTEGPQRYNR